MVVSLWSRDFFPPLYFDPRFRPLLLKLLFVSMFVCCWLLVVCCFLFWFLLLLFIVVFDLLLFLLLLSFFLYSYDFVHVLVSLLLLLCVRSLRLLLDIWSILLLLIGIYWVFGY